MSSGRRPRARFHASWSPAGRIKTRRTLVRLLGVLGAVLAVMTIGVNVYAVSFWDSLPAVRNIDSTLFQGDTIILDRNGQLIADVGIQGTGEQGNRRVSVGLDQISPKVVQGTIAIEDRTFWTNPGFDTQGILRSAANNFRAGSITGGGSTITQQLAKQLFLNPQQSLSRKAQEVALAYQLTQTYSKKQILEFYLNRSYYGAQQYGVQAAAQTYFHKDAKSVDLAQSAMLAGLPQSPDAYNPAQHFEAAKVRQKEVLDAMVSQGYITSHDAAVAYEEQLQVTPPVNNWKAPRFVDYVLSELKTLGYDPGHQQLTVKTTLDLGKQALAEGIIADNFKAQQPRDPPPGRLSSGMVAMDPKTGQILAYVGSPDPTGVSDSFDFVTRPINPGSSVKPFTYGKAILDGKITMDTPLVDGPSPYILNLPGGPPYKVQNYDLRTHGTLPARQALASSLNIPAVKVEMAEGVPAVVDFFRQMGMNPRTRDNNGNYHTDSPETSYSASLTLGGFPITLLEEVTALSAYADMGIYHPAEAILQVTGPRGVAPYQADPNRGVRQAVDAGVAFIIASILSDDTNRAPIFGLNSPLHLPDRRSAAKTGTSESFHDGLTIGFTPDLASAFWIGDTAGTNPRTGELYTMRTGSDGVVVAAPAWHKFMEAALKGVPDNWYQMPTDVQPGAGRSFFLKGSSKVDHLPGDNPSPTPSPGQNPNGVPPDPGRGPVPVDPRICQLRLPVPGCPPPTPGVPIPGG
jgi:membrane peptidoglycan carboxypeptidase